MYKLLLLVAVLCLACSVVCIATTVVEVVRGASGLGSANFWGAAAIHFVTALVGLFFLERASRIHNRRQKELPQ